MKLHQRIIGKELCSLHSLSSFFLFLYAAPFLPLFQSNEAFSSKRNSRKSDSHEGTNIGKTDIVNVNREIQRCISNMDSISYLAGKLGQNRPFWLFKNIMCILFQ